MTCYEGQSPHGGSIMCNVYLVQYSKCVNGCSPTRKKSKMSAGRQFCHWLTLKLSTTFRSESQWRRSPAGVF